MFLFPGYPERDWKNYNQKPDALLDLAESTLQRFSRR
jgi:hypothetical protein